MELSTVVRSEKAISAIHPDYVSVHLDAYRSHLRSEAGYYGYRVKSFVEVDLGGNELEDAVLLVGHCELQE